MIQVNPPAHIEELSSLEVADVDERLAAEELASLTIFSSEMARAPAFSKLPGSTILRRFSGDSGERRTVVEQGEPGATAFYILSAEDVVSLRGRQIALAREILALRQPPGEDAAESDQPRGNPAAVHAGLSRLSERELTARIAEWQAEIDRLKSEQAPEVPTDEEAPQRVAARVFLDIPEQRERFRWRNLVAKVKQRLTSGRSPRQRTSGSRIPVDAAAIADERTRTAELYEGQVFGEMSCMNRAPRSATVVAVGETYMLEMLRNVVDALYADKKFQLRMDRVYRERVLKSHLQSLPIFEIFDNIQAAKGSEQAAVEQQKAEFLNDLRELAHLESAQWGEVVFEEREPGNAVYLVRSGLLQVVQNGWTHLTADDLSAARWSRLVELADRPDVTESRRIVVQALRDILSPPKPRRPTRPGKPGAAPAPGPGPGTGAEPPPAESVVALPFDSREKMLELLNTFVRTWDVRKGVAKKKSELVRIADSPELTEFIQRLPEDIGVWSEYDLRQVRRELLSVAFRDAIPPQASRQGNRRVVRYLGPGDMFGEIGVVEGRPRSLSCVVYVHPESQRVVTEGREIPSRAELVRIDGDEFRTLCSRYPALEAEVRKLIDSRQSPPPAAAAGPAVDSRTSFLQAPEFDELGLIQGQQLMLIDLDRCTRCNACVDACADAHSDGYTRLYLDGPRVQNHLVPLTCRSCLDPLCMIGCPVAAINRGSNGQIEISDWCIGCRRCEEQCPYNAIQMHELPLARAAAGKPPRAASALGPEMEIKDIFKRAVVCDLCSSTRHGQPACVYSCPHDAAFRVNAVTAQARVETESR